MKKKFSLFIFLIICLSIFSQNEKKNIIKPIKIGFLYNYGINENFVFDDPDYTYSTNTYKLQAFYKLGSFKKIDFELIVQPQIQFLKHQLINEQFVTPEDENYLEKRAEFTQVKNMSLLAIEFGFAAKRKISKKLDIQGTISLGFSYIDTRSERLAKGFTFIENFSVGFSYKILKYNYLYIGTNFGHVSNLDFQKPNDGYNNLGLEIGYSFFLN
ncbi:acyloxyacyl hydrolase [uncultured Polaribacter sp.]|uniref:acyloxyacyl hydrolase n=1 Tax=uncultured Polaribacter sp. TaxID=174711 RepID=UPI0026071857|nr:acyloxyacyl hydrolase [uncultured Polaribacter sp.]